jgi:hypothetical protein
VFKKLFVLISFPLFFANTAYSQTIYTKQECSEWNTMAEVVAEYGETPLFIGKVAIVLNTNEPVIGDMVFAVNQQTGSWSLVGLYPTGISCLISSGENFEPYSE